MTDTTIRRALISVSDKTGLVAFATALGSRGVEILSTGGTARALKDAGLAVRDVAEHTGFPEMMDGRLKTLHPKVHGGLLAMRGNAEHEAAAQAHGIAPIDLLVVNLYPFEATVARGRRLRRLHREHRHRRARHDPRGGQEPRRRHRRRRPRGLRPRARRHAPATAAPPLSTCARRSPPRPTPAPPLTMPPSPPGSPRPCGETAPAWRAFAGRLAQQLRYGENPHQQRGVLPHGRAPAGRRHRRAAPGQGAVLQQPRRPRRRLELVAEFDPARRRGRHHQAHQPLRRRSRAGRSARPTPRPSAAIPSALRRHHRAQRHHRRRDGARDRRDPHRGRHRARRHAGGQGVFAAKKNLRLLTTGSLPDPRAPGLTLPLARRRLSRAVARQRRASTTST